MPRFFVEEEPREEFLLDGEDGRHGAKSLRLRPGEEVTLCVHGLDYRCVVLENRGDSLLLRVGEHGPCLAEPKTQITVCQCLPKGDKLEAVTQKSVELGAVAIRPVLSERCVSRPDKRALEKRAERLGKIAREAAQQSGRGMVPLILPVLTLEQAVSEAAQEGDVFFFYEKGLGSLRQAVKDAGTHISLFIGPEGGFSPEEAETAERLGAKLLTLGPRILRTETAPLAALAAILSEKGEMER